MTITIDYDRVAGYPQEHLTEDDISAVDMLQCAWADRVTLAKELMGFVVGSVIHIPHKYDAGDEPLENLWCRNVTIAPVVGGFGAEPDIYTKARLTVTYGTKPFDPDDPPDGSTVYFTESIEPATEYTTLDNKKLKWAGGGDCSGTDINVAVRFIDYVYTLHQVLFIPDELFTEVGKVNSNAIYSPAYNKTFAARTLLMGNPSLTREFNSAGVTVWTVTLRFTYNPNTWDKFPRPDSLDGNNEMEFDTIIRASDSTQVKPYKGSTFANIIL